MAVPVIGRDARVPPHDLEAEASVLGAILLDPAAIMRVLDFLNPQDFYRENHGQIYRAALSLFREGEPIDSVTIAAELEKMGVLERVGGRAQLAMLQESVPTAANVEHYARIVKDRAYKRRLITAGGQVTQLGYEDSLNAEEAVNQAQSQVYAISDDKVGSGLERLYDLLKPAMDRIDAQMAAGGGVVGIATGFHDLDRMTNGFKESDMVVIAGRPSMGKCLTSRTLIDDPATGDRRTIEQCVQARLSRVMGVADDGTVRPTEVADWVDSGVQECFRVRTRTGRTVEVTGHHPFLTAAGWQPLHDLCVGVEIAVPRVVPAFGGDETLSLEDARLLAYCVAEDALAGTSNTATEKRFPEYVWRFDRPRLTEFVRTLMGRGETFFSVGGHPQFAFSAAFCEMAEDLQHALTRLGVLSRLSQEDSGRWRVEVTDPAAAVRYQAEVAWAVEAGGPDEDEARLAHTGGVLTQEADAADLCWDEVVAIEPIGRHQVYDLTVPDGANFIAQDVVVHNTSFILNVALHAAIDESKTVAIFSLEMSQEQLVERMLCEQARIDAQRLHRGILSDVEYERLAGALGPLGEAPIYIDDAPLLDDLTLRLKARQAKAREGVQMIIIDYLQLMHGRTQGGDNRVQEVSGISRSLKSIARELRVPVVAISQLSRAPEARPDKRPILSDLRESGCLAGDSLVYLPDVGTYRPIRELVGATGFRVLALDAETWQLVPKVVTNSFCTGRKAVFRLTTRLGRTLRATANHKFLTLDGWRRLDNLLPSERIALPRRLPGTEEYSMSAQILRREPVGRVAAVLDSQVLQDLAESDVYWDEVTSIEPDGEEQVFDLTVEGLHNFVACDILVHNSIEQDADLVMFLYRDDYYNREKSEKPGIAEIIVAKHRNGPTGTVELVFRKELTRFENLDRRRADLAAGPDC